MSDSRCFVSSFRNSFSGRFCSGFGRFRCLRFGSLFAFSSKQRKLLHIGLQRDTVLPVARFGAETKTRHIGRHQAIIPA